MIAAPLRLSPFLVALVSLGLVAPAVAAPRARKAPAPAAKPGPAPANDEPAPAAQRTPAPAAQRTPPTRAAVAAAPEETPAQVPAPLGFTARSTSIVLGLGYHVDDGTMRGSDRRSIMITDETFDFANDNKLVGSLGFLTSTGARSRVGAVARYFGTYDYKQKDRDIDQLGQLFELALQAEYRIPMLRAIELVLGAQVGGVLLFPTGSFEKEIQDLRGQGAGVWNIPRLGYLLGPRAGVRWPLVGRLYVRTDLDITWSQTFLFFTHEEVDGVEFEKTRRANIIRYGLTASIEVAL